MCEMVYSIGNAKKLQRTYQLKNMLYDGDFVGACIDTVVQHSLSGLAKSMA